MRNEIFIGNVEEAILRYLYPYREYLKKQTNRYPVEISKKYMKIKGLTGAHNSKYVKELEQKELIIERKEKLDPEGPNSRYIKNLKRPYLILLITEKGVALVERLQKEKGIVVRRYRRNRKKVITDLFYLILSNLYAKGDGKMKRKEIRKVLGDDGNRTDNLISGLVKEELVTKERITEGKRSFIFKIAQEGREFVEEYQQNMI